MNVTAVPKGSLGYLTAWPTTQPQPYVSTLNGVQGQIAATAAIVPAETGGAMNVYVCAAAGTPQLLAGIGNPRA